MRNLSFVVAIAVSALVLGCQDNNMTNPISSNASGNHAAAFARPNGSLPDGAVDFKEQLYLGLADGVNNGFEVSGSIQYILVQSGDQTFELALVVRGTAEKLYEKGASGTIYGESMDYITLDGKQPAQVEKSYLIVGLDGLISLHVAFSVSETDVTVEKMWLTEDGQSVRIFN